MKTKQKCKNEFAQEKPGIKSKRRISAKGQKKKEI
jgi:hypothetical protein